MIHLLSLAIGIIAGLRAMTVPAAVSWAAGAILGTLGGAAARASIASAFGHDRPAAFIEDAVAIGGAVLIMVALS